MSLTVSKLIPFESLQIVHKIPEIIRNAHWVWKQRHSLTGWFESYGSHCPSTKTFFGPSVLEQGIGKGRVMWYSQRGDSHFFDITILGRYNATTITKVRQLFQVSATTEFCILTEPVNTRVRRGRRSVQWGADNGNTDHMGSCLSQKKKTFQAAGLIIRAFTNFKRKKVSKMSTSTLCINRENLL